MFYNNLDILATEQTKGIHNTGASKLLEWCRKDEPDT